jgi:selenide,water dikinase
MRRVGANAATDVTGFGLLGHLGEIIRASGVSAEMELAAIPLLPGVRQLAIDGVIPGGTRRNLDSVARYTVFNGVEDADRMVLADAQTSGGLLIAVDGALAAALLQALEDEGERGEIIGRLVARDFADGPTGRITVT